MRRNGVKGSRDSRQPLTAWHHLTNDNTNHCNFLVSLFRYGITCSKFTLPILCVGANLSLVIFQDMCKLQFVLRTCAK